MKGSACLLSSTAALGRAVSGNGLQRSHLLFSSSSSQSYAHSLPSVLTPSPTRQTFQSHRQNSTPLTQCRSLHASEPLQYRRGQSGKPGSSESKKLPRDHEIKHKYVVMRLEDGSVSEPKPTAEMLLKVQLGVEALAVVALPTKTGDEEHDARQPRYPVCRIINLEEERLAEQERAREQRKKAIMSKELEFNWSIGAHDMGHWMIKLREFLEKGFRVEIRLMKRTRGKARRQASMEEAKDLVRRIKETAEAIPGTKEVRPMEGALLQTVKMIYQGPVAKKEKRKKRKGNADEAEEAKEAEEAEEAEQAEQAEQQGGNEGDQRSSSTF